jgi:RNA polymerase sigma-70 factor (ECF subfamily)
LTEQDSFSELMSRLLANDQDAATVVFRRFAERLIGLARTKLDPRVLRKVDAEDVVQSAYRSFFTRHAEGRLEVSSWNELWSLLTVITARKCANQVAHYRAQRRDVSAELAPSPQTSSVDILANALDRDPTASEAATLVETVELLMRGLNADDRTIVELSLQGYSVQEISENRGCAERTVRRLRERVRERLMRMQVSEA